MSAGQAWPDAEFPFDGGGFTPAQRDLTAHADVTEGAGQIT
ncbi:hypothetical protein [Streptomyces griseorubiginosus]